MRPRYSLLIRIGFLASLIGFALIVVFLVQRGSTQIGGTPQKFDDTLPDAPTADAVIVRPHVLNPRQAVQRELNHVDPSVDGWETETFSDAASGQLQRLASAIITVLDEQSGPAFPQLLHPGFVCGSLRPEPLARVFQDSQLAVSRWQPPHPEAIEEKAYHGDRGLRQAMRVLLGTWRDADHAAFRAAFKIVRVAAKEDAVRTTVQAHFAGPTASGFAQQDATWTCSWQNSPADATPLLQEITVDQFEEVIRTGKSDPLLRESTQAVLGKNSTFDPQFGHGIDHWQSRLDWRLGLDMVGPHGLAIGDANGDGLDDLFVCEPGGLPNRLFVQNPDGTATDVSAVAGVDWLEPTASALFLDIDNDGDQDLVFASGRRLLFCENAGDATFQLRTLLTMSGTARSIAAADFNQDGKLDIYACCHFHHANSIAGIGLALPIPYHDANNGPPNYLFANQGDWQFRDVTAEVGLDVNNRRFSFAAAWEDYDRDGDLDLYVANDFGRNNLYRNDAGQFVDVAASAGVEDMASGMAVSWGDYNHDGHMDLYVANMFSSAGNRVMSQLRFRPAADEADRGAYRRFARGNSLFANNGDGTFRDVSLEAGVNMGRWAWGSLFADINNDGRQDILSGNGMITSAEDPGDL